VNSVLNVSAYRFVRIDDPHALREMLLGVARRLDLRGTILIAHEGINLFVAGMPAMVRELTTLLREDARFASLEVKESWSAGQPFRRMRVKVKREIIRMDRPAIQPHERRAPAVDAATARRWLDQGHDDDGRPVVTLDTRNAFEVDFGTFDGAVDWRLSKFSEFPAAVDKHRHELEGKTVISFCTGGIRCEKAVLYMQDKGLQNVYQLEGGILKYFEETQGAHFRGSCFVFDEREALDAALLPTNEVPVA
jgi:UPF0176 protein